MRYAQLVMGPAGSGKSTYCSTIQRHAADAKRVVEIVNLDPACENFTYQPIVDIRDLIQLDDAMEDEELHYGPNGGLIFCLEFLMNNEEWLRGKLRFVMKYFKLIFNVTEDQLCGGEETEDADPDDDYVIFDMPGQLELYTHLDMGKKLVKLLESWNFRVCGVFLIDSQFMTDGAKFISGTMTALSVMANLEIPHVNILSKMDLLSKSTKSKIDM
jgi:GPN-loop GTPase